MGRSCAMLHEKPTERRLTSADMDAILSMQERVKRALPRTEWLAYTTEDQFRHIFQGGGYGIGLFDEEESLLGAWVLYYPFERDDNLAAVLGLPRGSVAHYELAMLDESLRGRGIHRQMVEKLTEIAAQDGRFTHIAATAHPDNLASVRGFTGNGYGIVDTREMYGGFLRCILLKELKTER